MLIQSSVTRSIEAALSIAPDHGDRDFLCDWMPAGEAWHKCSKCDNLSHNICGQAVRAAEEEKDENYCHPLNFQSCSKLSTVGTMSENSTPTVVYHRKKVRRNSITPAQVSTNRKASDGCFSGSSSTVPYVFANEILVSLAEIGNQAVRAPAGLPFERNVRDLVSKSDSFTGFTVGDEPGSEDALTSGTNKVLQLCCMNDACSSSKSNVDLASTSSKPEVDDTAECSSSGALAIEGLKDNMSEKEVCISILRSFGSLGRIWPVQTSPSAEGTCPIDDNYCSQSCKVCDRSDATQKMLICDSCDEAFHMSCCDPRVKKIPDDEWFCHSCLKKKHKILKEKDDIGRCKNATSGGQSSLISMLKGIQPYLPGVRIGEEYQAEVPDWSGPILNDIDPCSEPLELNPVEYASFNGSSSKQPSRFSSIGNWLQCREVIEAAEGTVCRKWRRAPLFEVQTDDWECFRSVLWDPTHADCAVPQELDTDEVLRQLKYIEMLRPRLAAKKRKLDCAKSNGSQELTADVRNTQS